MATFRYPQVRELFDALNILVSELEGLGMTLTECATRPPRRYSMPYIPNAETVQRVTGRQACNIERKRRMELERLARQQVQDPGSLHPLLDSLQTLLDRADAFWRFWVSCREASERARAAVEAAETDLDGDERRPLKKPSYQLVLALGNAEKATNWRLSSGWDPFRWPKVAAIDMAEAAKQLEVWLEKIRPLRDAKGKPATGSFATSPEESSRDNRRVRLPELKVHDRQAWQLSIIHGMSQERIAAALNKEYGTTYTQGQVSRMITRAKAHASASGLAEKLTEPIDRPRTVDPGRLELGARIDKRKPRPSDKARANDDDE